MAFEGRSVAVVTHPCDRNGLSALILCPGSRPAACSDPAGPRTPAAAAGLGRLRHPQPWVPCGSGTPLLPLPSCCRGPWGRGGDRCLPSSSREILPALPAVPKRGIWLPASPRSSSSRASPMPPASRSLGAASFGEPGLGFGSPVRSREPRQEAAAVLGAG